MTPHDLEHYKVKDTPYMPYYYPGVPNMGTFRSTVSCFPQGNIFNILIFKIK